MRALSFFILFLTLISSSSFSQIGGKRAFEFMNISPSARAAATGGVGISSFAGDATMFLQNPSLIDSSTHHKMSVTYSPYLADIAFGTVTYSSRVRNWGQFAFGLQYFDYGDFQGYTEDEQPTGTFSLSDYAFSAAYAHQINLFRMGVAMKYAHSQMVDNNASALLLDLSTTFMHPKQDLVLAVVFKNLGATLSNDKLNLPSDLRVGLSVKPEHMPFRITVTAYNLLRNNLAYYDTGLSEDGEEETGTDAPNTLEKIFRHFSFGTELVLNQNFNLRAGYNHLVRKSLLVEDAGGLTGFSFGFMFRIKAFELAYSRSIYHVAGGSDYFTLVYDMGRILK